MTYIDTHVHLDAEEFDADRDAVVARAAESGVEALICPGISAASSEATVRLAQANDALFAAVGIQPNYCGEAARGDWDRIAALAGEPGIVGLGETGLDLYWDFTPLDVQQDYFDRHLRLAQQHGLPAIIHCREADADVLAMLREASHRAALKGVLHAFSGDAALAAECVALGLYVSFAGPVTYKNKKFAPLREAVLAVPDDRILLETDSPYLVPHPLRGKQKRNEPMNLIHTAQCLAELRGVDLQTLARQTANNARRLFGLN
jgi:TatD DNase family protein